MEPLTKICGICKEEKILSEFYKQKDGKFGFSSICKLCRKSLNKLYSNNNKKNIKIYQKQYYKDNKDAILSRNKEYKKEWEKRNKENRKKYIKQWCADNKNHLKEYRNNWAKKQRKENTLFKLNHNMSTAISRAVKNNKEGRSWETIIGYTLEELKIHLEKQFTEGMAWQNYGMWHIDHKVPIAAHNYAKYGHLDFKRCWALENLQPLWAHENLVKNASLDKPFQPSLLL